MLYASTLGLTSLKVILACPELPASKDVQTQDPPGSKLSAPVCTVRALPGWAAKSEDDWREWRADMGCCPPQLLPEMLRVCRLWAGKESSAACIEHFSTPGPDQWLS